MIKQILSKWETASHKAFPEKTVKWRKIKDFLGFKMIEFKFQDGETSSCSEKYFNNLFNKT